MKNGSFGRTALSSDTASDFEVLISKCTPTEFAADTNGANCSCEGGWCLLNIPSVGKWRNIFLDTK